MTSKLSVTKILGASTESAAGGHSRRHSPNDLSDEGRARCSSPDARNRERRLLRRFGFATALVALLSACAGVDGTDLDEVVAEADQELARPSTANLWPSGIVPICWTSSVVGHSQYSTITARILENLSDNFTPVANLHFEDAGPCPSNATGVVKVHNICTSTPCPNPPSAAVGYLQNGTNLYVSLNFPDFSTPALWQRYVLQLFAHILGFAHEHQRTDWSYSCDTSEPNIPGMFHYTSPDINSITTSGFCNSNTILSASDRTALSRNDVYGTPGAQRLLAFVKDAGSDVNVNWWNGSGWSWSELSTVDVDQLGSAIATRVGDRHQVHLFSTASNGDLVVHWWNGTSWSNVSWSDKDLISAPSVVSYRDYGKGPNGSFAESPVKIHAFAVDSGNSLVSRH